MSVVYAPLSSVREHDPLNTGGGGVRDELDGPLRVGEIGPEILGLEEQAWRSQQQERVVDGVVIGESPVLVVYFVGVRCVPTERLQHRFDQCSLRVLLTQLRVVTAKVIDPCSTLLQRAKQSVH